MPADSVAAAREREERIERARKREASLRRQLDNIRWDLSELGRERDRVRAALHRAEQRRKRLEERENGSG